MTLKIYRKRDVHRHGDLQEPHRLWCLSRWSCLKTELWLMSYNWLYLSLLGIKHDMLVSTAVVHDPGDWSLVLKPKPSTASYLDVRSCFHTCVLQPDRNSWDHCIITIDKQNLCSRIICLDSSIDESVPSWKWSFRDFNRSVKTFVSILREA